jgi:hypothetical protein
LPKERKEAYFAAFTRYIVARSWKNAPTFLPLVFTGFYDLSYPRIRRKLASVFQVVLIIPSNLQAE